jgi:hypothetical protein
MRLGNDGGKGADEGDLTEIDPMSWGVFARWKLDSFCKVSGAPRAAGPRIFKMFLSFQ